MNKKMMHFVLGIVLTAASIGGVIGAIFLKSHWGFRVALGAIALVSGWFAYKMWAGAYTDIQDEKIAAEAQSQAISDVEAFTRAMAIKPAQEDVEIEAAQDPQKSRLKGSIAQSMAM